jgi:hypothetical protein
VAKSVKVDADAFKAAIRALLNTPPTPATAIEGKRPRKADAKQGRREAPRAAEERLIGWAWVGLEPALSPVAAFKRKAQP